MGAEVEASVLLGRHTVGAVLVRARWVTWGAVLALPKGVGAARRDVRAAGVWVRDLLESLAPKERLALEQGVGEVVESQVGRGLSGSEVGTWTSSAGGVELEEEEAVGLVEGLEQLVEGEGSVEELVGKVSEVLLRDEAAARTLRSIRALAPGTRVGGQYEVEGLLGAGGFGVVYAVHNVLELTPKPLALKLLRSEERGDKKGERWLKREFALLREHAQEGLARVESLGVCGEHGLYFTMERLEGRTLREWLREEGRLGVGEGVEVVCKLLDTLGRLHGKGVTHRDVKPENVFVTGGGRVVLLDLGLAKGESGRRGGETVTGRGQVPGTARYMSPQRAEGGAASTVDDVYAASVVLFEVLTGESPFAIPVGSNMLGVLSAIRQGPRCGVRELRGEVPKRLGKVLGWALEPVVEDRREASRAEGLRGLLEVGLRAPGGGRKTSSWFGRLLSWGRGSEEPAAATAKGSDESESSARRGISGGKGEARVEEAVEKRSWTSLLEVSSGATGSTESEAAERESEVGRLEDPSAEEGKVSGVGEKLETAERERQGVEGSSGSASFEGRLSSELEAVGAFSMERTECEALFVQIALDNKLITNFQAKKAREELARLGSGTLDEIVVEMGFMTEGQRVSVLNAGRYRFQRDGEIAALRRLRKEGLVNKGEVQRAFQEQKSDYTMSGDVKSVGTYLLSRRKVTKGNYEEVLEQAKALKGFVFQGVEGATGRFLQETTGLVFRLIPGGSYLMGSPEGVGYGAERPQHEVRVEPFLLCETPCTQATWDRIAKGEIKDDRKWKGEELPIERVKWNDVWRWCEKAGLRLPSEAEWEYACRAGSVGAYCFGPSEEKLRDYAWFEDNSGGRTHPVGQKKPNAWGLHDMHGNVWERCEDDWGEDYEGAPSVGWPARKVAGASLRVYRGGSWRNSASLCRSAYRNGLEPGIRGYGLGFRPARSFP